MTYEVRYMNGDVRDRLEGVTEGQALTKYENASYASGLSLVLVEVTANGGERVVRSG